MSRREMEKTIIDTPEYKWVWDGKSPELTYIEINHGTHKDREVQIHSADNDRKTLPG